MYACAVEKAAIQNLKIGTISFEPFVSQFQMCCAQNNYQNKDGTRENGEHEVQRASKVG